MRISDWSSDVCSSDLTAPRGDAPRRHGRARTDRPPVRHAHDVRGRHRQGAGGRDDDRGSAAGDRGRVMPLYHYKALNSRGEALDGQMEAASDAEVVLRLQEQGHLPVEARLASEGGGEPAWRALFKAKPRSEEHTSARQTL